MTQSRKTSEPKWKKPKRTGLPTNAITLTKAWEGNSKTMFDTMKMLTRTQHAGTSVIEDKNGSLLTVETEVLRWGTEYCQELYNYKWRPGTSFLDNMPNTNGETGDVQEELEEAVHTLKGGKVTKSWQSTCRTPEVQRPRTQRLYLPEDLGKQAVDKGMDPILDQPSSQEGQPETLLGWLIRLIVL